MGKKCFICGKKIKFDIDESKIGRKYVCADCRADLPNSIRSSFDELSLEQIKAAADICSNQDLTSGGKIKYKNLSVAADGLIVNGFCWMYSDLESVGLRFHPTEKEYGNFVKGYMSVLITSKTPHIVFEELINNADKPVSIGYSIQNGDIHYSWDRVLTLSMSYINNALSADKIVIENFNEFFDSVLGREKQKERDKNRYSSYDRRSYYKRQWEEREKSSDSNNDSSQRRHSDSSSGGQHRTYYNAELNSALKAYGLTIPYTKDDVMKKRKELQKKVHPDMGGSVEESQKVNAWCDMLLKYIAAD